MRTLNTTSVLLSLSDEESPPSSNSDMQELPIAEAEANYLPRPKQISPAADPKPDSLPQAMEGVTNKSMPDSPPRCGEDLTSARDD